MSTEVQLVTALLSSLVGSGVLDKALAILRDSYRKKGLEQLPSIENGSDAPEKIEAALSKLEAKSGPSVVRELSLDAIAAAHEAATSMRKERMRQARLTFNAALTLAVLGVLVIFAGVGLLLVRDAVTAGATTTAVGAVAEVLSAILFRLNHETNNRLDEIGRNLSAIEAARIAMTLIQQINDPAKKDDAIRELAKDLRSRRIDATTVRDG